MEVIYIAYKCWTNYVHLFIDMSLQFICNGEQKRNEYAMKQWSLVNTKNIRPEMAYRWIQTTEEKSREKDRFLTF